MASLYDDSLLYLSLKEEALKDNRGGALALDRLSREEEGKGAGE